MSLHRILSSSSLALLLFTVASLPSAAGASGTTLRGTVESGGTGLAGYQVSLYARFVDPHGNASVVGRATIDPSGNVWLANNWKRFPILNVVNPGGNSLAVMVGAAGPVKTPLIGTPRSFDRGHDGERGGHDN